MDQQNFNSTRVDYCQEWKDLEKEKGERVKINKDFHVQICRHKLLDS